MAALTNPVFPIQVLLALITFTLLARWFVAPRLAGLPLETALQPLLAFHALRYIGLVFLAPGVPSPDLPQSFAAPAGIGTAIAGVLALLSITALRARWPFAIPLVWVMNVEGLADFANAFVQGATSAVPTQLGAAYYVPIVIVPAGIVTHVMMFGMLLRRRG
ncbi:MAG: hypothetical protein E6I57_01560 [Chloroflexi bacterium]|nr:MAG: hypothetical protein E6J49_00020 [Chloroflexota bacterium]TMC29359.1 MAG: hypothetical protein E6J27_05635 [Chloroflexota bacterium]TMC37489.1 MAG: hypothetical protein E6J24_00350 [Chloroflexota bacterium]TMC55399.1 MAG: hypothetical protein E6J19_13030 [Chloroflexota bacterium]TME43592.1 MAG: hypothetical protein E6I57_01560 [Chloroflexota bacterium]